MLYGFRKKKVNGCMFFDLSINYVSVNELDVHSSE